MASRRSPLERLNDIVESIDKIGRFLEGKGFADFSNDALLHDAVVRNLEILSEAARHLDETTKARAADIPWRQVADIGNWLRHAYEKVNDRILWQTIETDLPTLRMAVQKLIDENKPSRADDG